MFKFTSLSKELTELGLRTGFSITGDIQTGDLFLRFNNTLFADFQGLDLTFKHTYPTLNESAERLSVLGHKLGLKPKSITKRLETSAPFPQLFSHGSNIIFIGFDYCIYGNKNNNAYHKGNPYILYEDHNQSHRLTVGHWVWSNQDDMPRLDTERDYITLIKHDKTPTVLSHITGQPPSQPGCCTIL